MLQDIYNSSFDFNPTGELVATMKSYGNFFISTVDDNHCRFHMDFDIFGNLISKIYSLSLVFSFPSHSLYVGNPLLILKYFRWLWPV